MRQVFPAQAFVFPVFGIRHRDAVNDAVDMTTSDAFQQKLRLSVSNVPTGRHRLNVSLMWSHDATDCDLEARVQINNAADLHFH